MMADPTFDNLFTPEQQAYINQQAQLALGGGAAAPTGGGYRTDGNALVSLPNGTTVPVSVLAQNGVTGYTKNDDGTFSVPNDATFHTLDGSNVPVSQYGFAAQPNQQQPKTSSGSQTDASSTAASVKNVLSQEGLDELVPLVDNWIRSGLSWNEIELQLRDPTTEAGKVVDRIYPELQLRRKAGMEPLSIDQIQQLRGQYRQVFASHDVPQGFYDQPSDFTDLIVHNKSADELNSDLNEWRQVADDAAANPHNTNALTELNRLYGITPDSGAFLSYIIDPAKGLDVIRKQVAAGTLGVASARSGFGDLTQQQAEQLAAQGVSADQARQGFSDLVHSQELFHGLPGETDPGLTQDQQLGAEFGSNGLARDQVERVKQQRIAAFGGGGTIASGRSGDSGLTVGP